MSRALRATDSAASPIGRRKLGARVALALIALGPMLLDGATATTAVAVCVLTAAAALLMALLDHRGRTPPGAGPVLAVLCALCGFTFLQWLPMPCEAIEVLLPEERARIPRRVASLVASSPTCRISMDGGATLRALMLDGATLLAAYVGASSARVLGRTRVMGAIAASGVLIAATTLVHLTLGLTEVYGVYAPMYARYGLVGPLLNGNHLAAAMTLATPCCVALLLEPEHPTRRALAAFGLALIVATGFEAHSRLGLATLVLAAAISVLVVRSARRSTVRTSAWALLGAFAVAVAMAVVEGRSILADFVTSPYKTDLIVDSLRFAASSGTLGVGRGAFGAAFAGHATQAHRAMQPENLIALATSEMGIVVGPALLVLMGAFLVRRARARSDVALRLAAVALLCLLVHDLGDFAIEMPGLRVLAATLFGAFAVTMRSGDEARTRAGVESAMLAAGFVACLVSAPFVRGLDLDVQRAALERAWSAGDDRAAGSSVRSMVMAHPFDPAALVLASEDALRRRDAPRAIRFSNLARERAPGLSAPHETAYRVFRRARRAPQALAELGRVAALAPERVASLYCSEPVRPLDAARLSRALPPDDRATQVLRELRSCVSDRERAGLLEVASADRPSNVGLALEWLATARATIGFARTRELAVALRDRHPRDPRVAAFVAETELLSGRPEAAIEAVDAARRAGLESVDSLETEARAAAALRDHARMERALAALDRRREGEDAAAADARLRADCAAALGDADAEIDALTALYALHPSVGLLDRVEAVGRERDRVSAVAWARRRRCEDFALCGTPAPSPGGGLERSGNALDTGSTGSP